MKDASSTTIEDAKIISLPKVENVAGNITSINSGLDIPFAINRVYYLYDIPGGQDRGAHAHKELYQLVVSVSGSFTVTLNDGINSTNFTLKRPYEGLLICPGLWRELKDFSSGATCLVLASHKYDETDYLRNYKEFLKFKGL
jgi:hypothetical protein